MTRWTQPVIVFAMLLTVRAAVAHPGSGIVVTFSPQTASLSHSAVMAISILLEGILNSHA